MDEMWNLWHGCHKGGTRDVDNIVGGYQSEGCQHCYVFRLDIREQCIAANVPFHFKQTGAHFRKDDRLYNIPRNQQMKQAHKAGIDYAYK